MEVIVQDANNIVIEVDQGRQGRGVEDVSLITVGADYYLLFTFTDGTTDQVGPIATTVTEVISAEVRNAEAVTILKGQPVYLFQAQGNLATVKLAYNTSDATSAKTLGLAAENIAPNAQGLVTCQGTLGGLNTSAYNEGDTLYLGATAGTLTNVKPQAPNHLVYIGVVERANAGAGQIYVRVQNGFELDEIHDVRIISPVNGNTLIYDASTSLWKNAGITAGSGISVTNGPASITVGNTGVLSFSGGTTGLTPATATTGAVSLAGTLAIANGGTGQTTANAALNALLPSQATQSGKYLKTDGTNASWDQLDISTADITGVLPTANGGTGLSSFTANRVLYASSTSAIGQSANLTFDGNNLGVGSAAGSNARLFAYANDATLPTLMARQDGAGPMQVWQSTGGAEAMRFNSTGLGIGNSAPNTKLDITTTANNGIRLFQTGAANAWNIYTSGNNLRFIEENVGSVMAINAGGNVGIGTTSPGVRLDVSGSVRSSATVTASYLSGFDQTYISSNGATGNGCVIATVNFAGSVYQPITYDASTYIWRPNGTERMRLDSSGNLGIGTSSPAVRLDVEHSNNSSLNMFRIRNTNAGASAQTVMLFGNDVSSGAASISVSSNVNSTSSNEFSILNRVIDASSKITFGTQNTERARIDGSGNLLVGTTTNTNSSRLTVNGTISETVSSVQYLVASQFDVGTAPNKIPLNQYLGNLAYQNASAIAGQVGFSAGTAALPSIASATDLTTGRWFPSAGVMAWSTGGVERMRLDASGNLGLGVTPVAWNVAYRALDMGAGAFMAQPGASDCYILQNAYFDTGWKYRYSSTLAARYSQINGVHSWSNAPSGTAGNAISFTQAMTLDASGNLALGTTTPFTRFDSASARTTALNSIASFNTMPVSVTDTTAFAQGVGGGINFRAQLSSSSYSTYAAVWSFREVATNSDYKGSLLFGTADNTLGYPIERMRITSTGNQVVTQTAESAQNVNSTLTVANLQARIITSNAAVTLTLPTGTVLDTYVANMTTDTAFECTFIATTANAITIAANGNITVGSLTVAGNTSGTFRFRKTAANTFTVYRVA